MGKTQKNRPIEISTPLGEDILLLTRMTATEQLGRLFQLELELVSENLQIKPADIIGQNITVRLSLADKENRYFNGFINRFVPIPSSGKEAQYKATAVPWLWFLTRTADCRIFQEKKAPDIIKQIFRDHGFSDFEDRLTNPYRTWEYCVQYRETDFNFISRMMEQEGIYYFFKHENGKHTLVLADSVSAHEPYTNYEIIKYRPYKAEENEETILQWHTEFNLLTGTYTLNDFDFKNTKKDLITRSSIARDHILSDFELFDYPGKYDDFSDGEKYSKMRIEELQAQYEVATGFSDARGIMTGATFTLAECPREDQNKEYLIISANYSLDAGAFESVNEGSGKLTYACNFCAIDSADPYRSLRSTPKPTIPGPQTAIVVGPSGEEIYTDQYGRIKVQFHWDRRGKADENSSCWIRVAQSSAGKKWGAIYLPRIGQEVVVEFLEGDPDQPIVTGVVYNGTNMPPYALPEEKTKSTIKTDSSKGGDGFNEIRFEDKKGDEQIFIHAEKDQDIRVKNDLREWIGNDRHLIVTADQYEQVDGDKHQTVSGDQNEKVSGTVSLDAGMDLQQKVGMKYGLEAGNEIHLKGGMKVILEAGMQLTIKAGASYVDLGPAGVTIQGTLVKINSGGAAGSGSGCSPDAAKLPEEADNAEPGELLEPLAPKEFSPAAKVLMQAAVSGTPFCEKCAAAAAAQKG